MIENQIEKHMKYIIYIYKNLNDNNDDENKKKNNNEL